MPKPLKRCTTRDCPELTRGGKCSECRRQASAARAADTRAWNSPRWRAFSKAWLRKWPLCFICGNAAAHVDHIDGLGPAGPRGYDPENLQSLCRSCHSKKTVRQDGGFGRYYADRS